MIKSSIPQYDQLGEEIDFMSKKLLEISQIRFVGLLVEITVNTKDPETIRVMRATRGSPKEAFWRQVAMYLVHVVLAKSIDKVSEAFDRDRSTVHHAISHIEDMRENIELDEFLNSFESIIRSLIELPIIDNIKELVDENKQRKY